MVIALVFSAIAIVLWMGGYDVIAGRMSGGELASFVFYAVVAAGSVAALSDIFGDLQRAAGPMDRIVELLQTQPAIIAPALPKSFHAKNEKENIIYFESVSFSYPSRPDQLALNKVSLHIKKGQHIGFAGGSGSGKTTLFQLLLRFYDPQQGIICIDGLDIKQVDPIALRQRFAFVAQDPVIFSGTLAENIRYSNPSASMEDIRRAADAALVTEFLPSLPQGFDTFLGERGTRLSGGQRQRVEIARAILRNADILLFDEATSQIDNENERLVQQALERLMQGRTTLTIAHRLSTLRGCDQIYVLEDGRIVGNGSHDELLRNNSAYQLLSARG